MIIYVDIIIIENIIMNVIILLITNMILKIELKSINIFLASLIGAIYTLITYIFFINQYSNVILKIILSIIIIYIAYKPRKIKNMFKYLIVFYGVSFFLAGIILAVSYMNKNSMMNEIDINIIVILIGVIIGIILIILMYKVLIDKIKKKNLICEIQIKIENTLINTLGIIDTGNFLKEPITGISVVVLEKELLKNVIPIEILENIDEILGGDTAKIPQKIREKNIKQLKFIPFSSLGKEHGMLLGVKSEYVKVFNDNEMKRIEGAIIGIYNGKLTQNGGYNALIGMEYL